MYIRRIHVLILSVVATGVGLAAHTSPVHAGPVALQEATATFSQAGFDAADVFDPDPDAGWAISTGSATSSETAVFETVANLGFSPATGLTFTLEFLSENFKHNLGRFRLSVTTDDRSLFADGLQSGGDVTANWTILDPLTFSSSGGATITELGDMSLLLSGTNPDTDTYTVTAQTALTGITGFRLEALADASLPDSGPGRAVPNGNFVLSGFTIDAVAVPEPGALVLACFAALGLCVLRRGRRQ